MIDPDTEHLLREESQRTGKPFKVVLNDAVRTALHPEKSEPVRVVPLFDAPFPRSLAAANFNHVADDWDDAETLRELAP